MSVPVRTALLVLALTLGGTALPTAQAGDDEAERKVKVPGEDPALARRVHAAIDRGVAWLLARQQEDGSWHQALARRGPGPRMPVRHTFGETALVTLTLAHAGLGPEHEAVQRAVRWLRREYRSQMTGDFLAQASSYGLSLFVLALDELHGWPARERDPEREGRYAHRKLRKRNPCGYPSWVKKILRNVVRWMLEHRAERGLWRYPGGLPGPAGAPSGGPGGPGGPGGRPPPGMPPGGMPPGGGGPMTGDVAGPEDLSNTQYVLLALWVGARCGVRVDPDVVVDVGKRLLVLQEKQGPEVVRAADPPAVDREGRYGHDAADPDAPRDEARGFPYVPGGLPTGSMTAAGLSSLLIVKGILQEEERLEKRFAHLLDEAIWDALAWLATNHDVRANPRAGAAWHHYYLYGLERALVIARKRHLGGRAWYPPGARWLCDAQEASGRWAPPNPGHGGHGMAARTPLWDTCFALLFLLRASVQPRTPILPRPKVTTPSGD